MAADGSSDKTTHPLLTRRHRTELFVSPYLQASVRKMRKAKKQTVAATLALLLFVVVAEAFLSRGGRMRGARFVHESGNRNDATLLLAKATDMTNSDEAKALLEALENGTVDFEDVSSALEEDAARKAAKIKDAIENEASRKAAEEKAAAEKAAAEKAAAEKAAAEKAAAERVAALKAAAERIAAEKAAAEKAAAEKASIKMRKTDPQPRLDDFFDNGDDYYNDDEDDWLGDDFEDEIDEGDGLAFSRGEQKRSVNHQKQGGGRAPSRKGNNRVPNTNGLRQKMDRNGALSLSVDAEEEEEDVDWLGDDFEEEIDIGDGLAFSRGEQKRSVNHQNQGGGRAPSRKGNSRVPSTNGLRQKMDRKGALSLSVDAEEEEDEDDWLGDDFEDEFADGVDGLPFTRAEQKRSDSYSTNQGRAPVADGVDGLPFTRAEQKRSDSYSTNQGRAPVADGVDGLSFPRGEIKRSDSYSTNQGRAPSRKENDRVPSTKSLRARINRKGSPNIFDEMEERKLEPERRNDVDENHYRNNKHRRKSSALRLNQKSKSLSSKSSKSNNRRTSSGS